MLEFTELFNYIDAVSSFNPGFKLAVDGILGGMNHVEAAELVGLKIDADEIELKESEGESNYMMNVANTLNESVIHYENLFKNITLNEELSSDTTSNLNKAIEEISNLETLSE